MPEALVLASVSLACQGPLKDGEFLNEPMISLTGTITPAPHESSLAVGLLWVDPIQADSAARPWGSKFVHDRIAADGRFSMDLYARPPDAAIRWLKGSADSDAVVAFAWGELVLYEDRDDDAAFSVGPIAAGSPMLRSDVYRGGSSAHVVVYVAQPLDPARSLIPGLSYILESGGYHVGKIGCRTEGQVTWVDPVEPEGVILELGEPSETLPRLRNCVTSHPEPTQ